MNDSEMIDALEAHRMRLQGRRAFFRTAVGAAAIGAGFAFASAAEAQTVTDADVLNFALNLEYLEANFYYQSVYGTPIPAAQTTGTVGTLGAVNVAGATAVPFSDPVIAQFAREIAEDELNHVKFLRTALGAAAVAQPALDLSASASGAFSAAARAANLIPTAKNMDGTTAATQTSVFNPYANDLSFLYAAFIFEDVGVTAYKGASPLITSKAYLDAAAGILAVEAHHAAIIRGELDRQGATASIKTSTVADAFTATVRGDTERTSNARDSLDGATDLDQGVERAVSGSDATANIAPTDSNGIAFSRTTGQVLNIVYLNKGAVTAGGFFPAGVNGSIKTSTAQA